MVMLHEHILILPAQLLLFLTFFRHVLVHGIDTPFSPFILYEGQVVLHPDIAVASFLQTIYDLPAA